MAETHSVPARIHTVPTVSDRTVVALHGEIDLFAVGSLSARFDALTAEGHPDLVVDLSAVTFIDCSGLGMLCRARNRVTARHGRLRLVTDSPGLLRMLRPVGLAGVFEVCAELSDLVASPSGRPAHGLERRGAERPLPAKG
ncbi:STAS domain-containing protein [Streptomyces sp. NPDC019531]|uniref:STAS domain-containing protein n=1 Tax=Streptomyces sp. NPDC019531 TaxID=3365062 RepID=UPI00384E754D